MVDKDYNIDINSEDKFEINIEDTTYTLEINPTDSFEIQLNEQGPQGDRGLKGDKGNDGLAATVEVGTTTTGLPETEAIVTNVGTENNAILNFKIPAGVKGDKGDKGDTGEPGTTDYNELINKPTKLTDFEDNLGNHPVHTHEQYAEITDLENYYTKSEADNKFVNKETTINNKSLSSNINLNYNDVGALPNTTTINDLTTDSQQLALNSGCTQYTVQLAESALQQTDVQSYLDIDSIKPVQNGTITQALNNKVNYSDISNMATTNTAQDITGPKSFVGENKLNIRQQNSNDIAGINIQDDNNVTKGTVEYNKNLNTGYPLLSLNNYAKNSNNIIHTGFSRYSAVSNGAYNLLTPLIANSKTPFNLTSTYKNFYMPLGFTDGNTTVLTANSGMVDISTFLSDFVTTGSLATTLIGYVTNASLETTLSNYSTTDEIAEEYYNKTEIDSKLRKLPTGGGSTSLIAGDNVSIDSVLEFNLSNFSSRIGYVTKIVSSDDFICAISNDTLAYSNDNGTNWTFNINANGLVDITFGNNLFVGVTTDGKVTTTQDFVTWTTPVQIQIPSSYYPTIVGCKIAYGVDKFVVIMTTLDKNNYPYSWNYTSEDCINWTFRDRVDSFTNGVQSFKCINDVFYIGYRDDCCVDSSTDGITFNQDFTGYSDGRLVYGFASNGRDKLIGVGSNKNNEGVVIVKDLGKPFGNAWTSGASITNEFLTSATYVNGYYYVLTHTGKILRTKDLTNWKTVIEIDNIYNTYAISYKDGAYIVGGTDSSSMSYGLTTLATGTMSDKISADDITSADVVSALGYTPVDESDLSTVATSGSYNDLTDKPTIPQEVFIAEYGTTSYADVLAAYNAGKEIVCLWKMWNRQSSTMSINDNVFNFHFPLQVDNFRLTLDSTNTWNTNRITLQSTNNRVTSIDSSSTNNTYPTSKAVYDAIPSAVTESTVSGWGFTKNEGTVTSVNNVEPVNGNVTLSIPQQVQANWSETDTTSKAYIQNKPTIPDTSTLANTSLSNLTSTGNNLVNTALNTRDNSTRLKFWTGTKAQYDAISTKDSNTLYNITDDQDITLTLLQTIYPVGSVYLSTNSTCPLASLFGTWTLVSSDRALWTGTGSNGGSTIEAGLPNITGTAQANVYNSYYQTGTGAFETAQTGGGSTGQGSTTQQNVSINFDASLSNPIYGNSTTVQPPAYVVNVWRRTA